MFVPGKYTVVARTMSDVPAKALPAVRPQIAATLGGSVRDIFPEFARSFPLTVASMEAHWSKPMLEVREGRGWFTALFLEQPMLNLFLNDAHPIYAYEPYFDVSMLPERWGNLYRSMSSFTITDRSAYSPLGWRNTPLPRSMDVDQFGTETHTKKAKLKAFEKQLGVTNEGGLRCWMLTDAYDSLWIDQQHCDQKVYHVHGDAFVDAYVLPDPGETLDLYMAHVVAGGLPKDFNFRKSH